MRAHLPLGVQGSFVVVLLALAPAPPAWAAEVDRASSARQVQAPAAVVLALLEEPEGWPEVFRDASAVRVRSVDRRGGLGPMGEREVAIRSPAADHAHTLRWSARSFDEKTGRHTIAFSFADEEHPVGFTGRFVLGPWGPAGEGSVVRLQVAVERTGALRWLPDRLVKSQVRSFLSRLLDDLAGAAQRRADAIALR